MRHRAISATAWSAADILLRQGAQFAISVVLARLLTPAEFGTIALLYLFVGIAGAFAEGGLTSALIQRRDTTLEDESTVFWLNMAVGAVMAAAFWLSGPLIAAVYGIPVLEPLAGVMALTVLAGAAGAVQRAQFTKAMNFRPLMVVGLVSVLLSGAVAIWLALTGWGVWALAVQSLLVAALTTLLTWVVSPWRPAATFSLASARRLFGFGGYMLASALLDVTYTRLYTVLLGKLYGVTELGFYARADSTAQLPASVLTGIVGRVAFPHFSSLSADRERFRRSLKLAMQGSMLLQAPAMLGLAAVAEPVVDVLFGRQWLPAVPFLQVLCLAGVLMPLHVLNLQALMGLGRSDLFFRLEILKKIVGVAILLAAAAVGPIAVAWGMVVAGIVSYFLNANYLGVLLGYGAASQLRDVAPVLGAAAVMAGAVAWLCEWLHWDAAPLLAVAVVAGAALYAAIVLAFRLSAALRMLELVRKPTVPIIEEAAT